MCRQPIKPKTHYLSGQVILETAIIFVCLSAIAIASMRLFSNLNLNIVNRLQVYRDSRLNAVNSPASLAGVIVSTPSNPNASLSNPLTFLDYFPEDSLTLPPDSLGGGTDWTFYEEPRINDAALLLEEQGLIMNLIGPYKINQANYLAGQLQWGTWWKCCDSEGNYYPYIGWNYPDYITLIKNLANETINYANQGYDNFVQAINLYTDVLNNPTVPGPYDPNVAANAELYGLDPVADAQAIANLQTQNDQNRQNLQLTINSLTSALPGLDTFRDMLIYGSGPFRGLDYVRDWIGDTYCDEYGCSPSWRHNQAVDTLGDAVDFTGTISSSVLSSGLASKINQVYSLLQSPVSYDEASSAKTLAEEILADSQVQSNSELESAVTSLRNNLNSAIRYWDDGETRDYYLDYAGVEGWALSEVAEITALVAAISAPYTNPPGFWWWG